MRVDAKTPSTNSPEISEIRGNRVSLKSAHILGLASKGPIVIYPTTTVKDACRVMVDNGIRRVPVVDPGTHKLSGIVSGRDLVSFFGGGQKYNIVKNTYGGNLFAAINLPITKIMEENVICVKESDSIEKAAATLLDANVGGCPVINREGEVTAIVSEMDFIRNLRHETKIKTRDIMSTDVITVTPGMSIGDAARIMINMGKRRLPVVHNGEVVGVLRTTDILRFISNNEFASFGTVEANTILKRESVGEAMNTFFLTMTPEDDIEHLIEVMIARRLGGFPVEADRKLAGIVTEHDIFKFFYSRLLY